VPDPDYGEGHEQEISASIPPAHAFAAHVAPLGMTFYEPPDGTAPAAFPERYRGAAFVAQHGSWNRSKKSGYQVVALRFGSDGTITEEPFATGFMRDERAYGRPVDPVVGPDGALYVSDDFTGSVYRIAYGNPATGRAPAAGRTEVHPDPLAGLSEADVAAAVQRGEELWTTQPCPACHVPGQAAPAMLHPLSGLRSKYTIDSLAAFLRAPRPPMPPVMLPDDARRDLAIYLLVKQP
jgi:cytochrome c553